jgi:DNA repair protein RecN (Recombination protein N)
LIAKRDEFDVQLQEINSYDESIAQLKQQVDEAYHLMEKQALHITQSRQEQIPFIEQYMVEQLVLLGMPNVQVKIELEDINTYSENGKDKVVFLFSANKNRGIQAVETIASGGEVSRLMLTVKSLLANKSDLPTIIFDEIDTGVSGEIANRMGDIMREMGHHMQVIAITHLPQIAAKGKHHYRVYKDESGKQTETYIEKLAEHDRINEIASMLSGERRGEAALQNAKELLHNS